MPLNVPGILAPVQFLVNPRIIVPSLSVRDIRHLDFDALKRAGYRGAVFDKDNCLTLPGKDTLVPEIEEAWKECKQVFGKGNVLVVSNTAGAHVDAGGIQAESVRHHLGVPVLFHTSMKPAYSCVKQIRSYFRSLRNPIKDDELIIVGDRLFTDIVMANRIREQSWTEPGPLAAKPLQNLLVSTPLPPRTTLGIWTTGLWVDEATGMRFCEKKLLEGVKKWVIAPAKTRAQGKASTLSGLEARSTGNGGSTNDEDPLTRVFVRDIPPPALPQKQNMLRGIANFFQGIQFRRGN
ncbi:mitochondrial PGP phosphatase-domain-containing protein [Lentinula lateritia]|nr:mitochondrial PGP phosphatase-domain-containing protein [Lentinula lateritia]